MLIETAIGPIDVVQGLPGVPSYADLSSRSGKAEFAGMVISRRGLQTEHEFKRVVDRPLFGR